MTDDAAEARREAESYRLLLQVRALLAVAESSPFAEEARAFADKAMALASRHDLDPRMLRFPREPLQVAVVVAELQRLQEVLERYEGDADLWATKSAEWSTHLDEYDAVLEAAAEILHLPVPHLPYGCRRHFRPEQRLRIGGLIRQKVVNSRIAPNSDGMPRDLHRMR